MHIEDIRRDPKPAATGPAAIPIAGSDEPDRRAATLSPDRLLDIRRRIAARQHDHPEIIRGIARRIVESGDL